MRCPERVVEIHPFNTEQREALADFILHARDCVACARYLQLLLKADEALEQLLCETDEDPGRCPPVHSLILWTAGERDDLDFETHLIRCTRCRADVLAAAPFTAGRRQPKPKLRVLEGGNGKDHQASPRDKRPSGRPKRLPSGKVRARPAAQIRSWPRRAAAAAVLLAVVGLGATAAWVALGEAPQQARSTPTPEASFADQPTDSTEQAELERPTPLVAKREDVTAVATPEATDLPPPVEPAPDEVPDDPIWEDFADFEETDPATAEPEPEPKKASADTTVSQPVAKPEPRPSAPPRGPRPGEVAPRTPVVAVAMLDVESSRGLKVKRPGERKWRKLGSPETLSPGTALRASGRGGMLALAKATIYVGPRARLAYEGALTLRTGQVFYEGAGALDLQHAVCAVQVSGQALFKSTRSKLAMASLSGSIRCRIIAGREAIALAPGQRLRVTERGTGKPQPLPGSPGGAALPNWVRVLRPATAPPVTIPGGPMAGGGPEGPIPAGGRVPPGGKPGAGKPDAGKPDAPGNSGNAPGQGGSAPGNSGNAPGQGGSAPGNSGNSPGSSSSAPGQSGNAPGSSGNGGSGNAPGNSGNAPRNPGTSPGNSGNNSGNGPGNSGNAPGSQGQGSLGSPPGHGSGADGSWNKAGNAGNGPTNEATPNSTTNIPAGGKPHPGGNPSPGGGAGASGGVPGGPMFR